MTATPEQRSTGDPTRPLPYPRTTTPAPEADEATGRGLARRGFLGWAIAAPTLMVGTSLIGGTGATRRRPTPRIPAVPEPADLFDLGDLQNLAALPTSNLITITVGTDGVASFALPRAEVGQGITTSTR